MKPSLMFVDDEPNVLDGLKRLLSHKRGLWDMTFCLGARQALAQLDKKPFDMVVTDLVMPEMDGGVLLEEVQRRHPEVVRVVLSGHSGKHLAMKASRYAHQFLAKPIKSELLQKNIERLLSIRDVMVNPQLRSLITRMDTLPTLPKVHQRILAELNAQEPAMGVIAELITQDMGLSASMLKLVNSAFFGLPVRVSSPAHAVNLLGLDVISGLVLTVQLFSNFDENRHKGFHLDGLWRHCLYTGLVCKALARSQGHDQAGQDNVYVAGILHDVGKLILLCYAPELYEQVLENCREENRAVWKSEKDILGCTHAELGAYLLSLWGFSEEITRCVYHHHNLSELECEEPMLPVIVHAANAFDHELRVSNAGYDQDRLELEALGRRNFLERLPEWRQTAQTVLTEASDNECASADC